MNLVRVSHFRGPVRALFIAIAALASMAALAQPAAAQATYVYTGKNFNVFSCPELGGDCPVSLPLWSSYTANDFITVTLQLDSALPPNLPFQGIGGRPGFHMVVADGRQTFSDVWFSGAEVETDANGEIRFWRIYAGVEDPPVRGRRVFTTHMPGHTDDMGYVREDPMDYGARRNDPGVWSVTSFGCQVTLNRDAFSNGQTVTATDIRFVNRRPAPTPVEIKIWFEAPGLAPIPIYRVGADGSAFLPANSNTNLGPGTLFTVTPSVARGDYAFSCRIVDPVTGALVSESLKRFVVQ